MELWSQDEARFGQQGTLTRVWALCGSRPRRVRQTEYGWRYVFGAVCVTSGAACGWVMNAADTEMMNIFLRELGLSLAPDVQAVLLLDRAGWHTAKRLQLPENITLLLLPPYSPELNPAELLWRELRRETLSNREYEDEEQLEEAVVVGWNRLTDDPQRLRSLCCFPWMASAVNN